MLVNQLWMVLSIADSLVTRQERAQDVGERLASQHREQMVEKSTIFKVVFRRQNVLDVCIYVFATPSKIPRWRWVNAHSSECGLQMVCRTVSRSLRANTKQKS